MTSLFWIAVGVFIGWNMPQPTWAKELQNKVVSAIKRLGGRRSG